MVVARVRQVGRVSLVHSALECANPPRAPPATDRQGRRRCARHAAQTSRARAQLDAALSDLGGTVHRGAPTQRRNGTGNTRPKGYTCHPMSFCTRPLIRARTTARSARWRASICRRSQPVRCTVERDPIRRHTAATLGPAARNAHACCVERNTLRLGFAASVGAVTRVARA